MAAVGIGHDGRQHAAAAGARVRASRPAMPSQPSTVVATRCQPRADSHAQAVGLAVGTRHGPGARGHDGDRLAVDERERRAQHGAVGVDAGTGVRGGASTASRVTPASIAQRHRSALAASRPARSATAASRRCPTRARRAPRRRAGRRTMSCTPPSAGSTSGAPAARPPRPMHGAFGQVDRRQPVLAPVVGHGVQGSVEGACAVVDAGRVGEQQQAGAADLERGQRAGVDGPRPGHAAGWPGRRCALGGDSHGSPGGTRPERAVNFITRPCASPRGRCPTAPDATTSGRTGACWDGRRPSAP